MYPVSGPSFAPPPFNPYGALPWGQIIEGMNHQFNMFMQAMAQQQRMFQARMDQLTRVVRELRSQDARPAQVFHRCHSCGGYQVPRNNGCHQRSADPVYWDRAADHSSARPSSPVFGRSSSVEEPESVLSGWISHQTPPSSSFPPSYRPQPFFFQPPSRPNPQSFLAPTRFSNPQSMSHRGSPDAYLHALMDEALEELDAADQQPLQPTVRNNPQSSSSAASPQPQTQPARPIPQRSRPSSAFSNDPHPDFHSCLFDGNSPRRPN